MDLGDVLVEVIREVIMGGSLGCVEGSVTPHACCRFGPENPTSSLKYTQWEV